VKYESCAGVQHTWEPRPAIFPDKPTFRIGEHRRISGIIGRIARISRASAGESLAGHRGVGSELQMEIELACNARSIDDSAVYERTPKAVAQIAS